MPVRFIIGWLDVFIVICAVPVRGIFESVYVRPSRQTAAIDAFDAANIRKNYHFGPIYHLYSL